MTKLLPDLLPCPFCGGKDIEMKRGDARKATSYSCQDCGCFLTTGETWQAPSAWNRLAQPPSADCVMVGGLSVEDLNNAIININCRLQAIDDAFKESEDEEELCGRVSLNVALARHVVKSIQNTLASAPKFPSADFMMVKKPDLDNFENVTDRIKNHLDDAIELLGAHPDIVLPIGIWRTLNVYNPEIREHRTMDCVILDVTEKELYDIKCTLGAMAIQEKRGMWASWWGKFCRQIEPRLASAPHNSQKDDSYQLWYKGKMIAGFSTTEELTQDQIQKVVKYYKERFQSSQKDGGENV